jgi:non-canonical (house-cleaning) NTP pyrophosphatase
MSEYQADQEDTVLAYVRLKSGERPFNRYGEGAGFNRQAAKEKAAKGKQPLYSNNVIDLAAERAKRARRK